MIPTSKIHIFFLIAGLLILQANRLFAQEDTTKIIQEREDVFNTIEKDQMQVKKEGQFFLSNYDKWEYSKKQHAIVAYYGSIFQYAINNEKAIPHMHHDLGIFYKGSIVNTSQYKMKVELSAEQNSLLLGKSSKEMARQMGMFSLTNASTVTSDELNLNYFFIENVLFDGVLNLGIGKIDPFFLSTMTTYSSWDKMTFFSKTAVSDPVPPLDSGFGLYGEINLNNNLGLGGLVLDNNPRSKFMDISRFFNHSSKLYQFFLLWSFPSKKELHSYHIVSYYLTEQNKEHAKGNGITYVANQGISDKLGFAAKLYKGWGRTDAYDGAYSVGIVMLNPFVKLKREHIGASLILNEKDGNFEYGIDTYLKMKMTLWMAVSANIQVYHYNQKIGFFPGLRLMFTY